MTDSNHSYQGKWPLPIIEAAQARSDRMPIIEGISELDSTIETSMRENVLFFSEIDRLLATASAMAKYCERNSVADAISLAIRINRMDYEGRHQELVAQAAGVK